MNGILQNKQHFTNADIEDNYYSTSKGGGQQEVSPPLQTALFIEKAETS